MAAAKKRRKAADKPASRKEKVTSALKAPVKTEPAPRVVDVKIEADERRQKILSDGLMNHTIGRLAAVMRNHGTSQPTDNELDFGIKAFLGLKPDNTAEMLLCSQMVAVHECALAMLTRAKMADGLPQMQESGTLAIKLFGMFERQFATLQKVRQPKQIVEVRHEHRHVHAHGTPLPGPQVVTQIEGQPYGTKDPRALAFAPGTALPGEDAPADLVPVARDAERSLPNPRRCLARRTKR